VLATCLPYCHTNKIGERDRVGGEGERDNEMERGRVKEGQRDRHRYKHDEGGEGREGIKWEGVKEREGVSSSQSTENGRPCYGFLLLLVLSYTAGLAPCKKASFFNTGSMENVCRIMKC
jgi:hypothetical protein